MQANAIEILKTVAIIDAALLLVIVTVGLLAGLWSLGRAIRKGFQPPSVEGKKHATLPEVKNVLPMPPVTPPQRVEWPPVPEINEVSLDCYGMEPEPCQFLICARQADCNKVGSSELWLLHKRQ
jgi:hypothetical protein